MRKKDILGNFVKNPDVLYTYRIKKVSDAPEAYSALVVFSPGCRELVVDLDGARTRLAGPGYRWLTYLPLDECWCVTVLYNPDNGLIDWYFDISKGNFLDESRMPCIDDIFLDLVIKPDGRAITIDAEELQEALDDNVITADEFDYAYRIREKILTSRWNDVEYLLKFSEKLLSEYN